MFKYLKNDHWPRNIFLAICVVGVFELAYLFLLDRWLGNIYFFKLHLPALLSLSTILFATGVSYYEYHSLGVQHGVIRRVTNKPIVALTFDDGPNPVYTNQILDILKEKKVTATFFMVGKHIEKYPEVAQRVYREGHEIGNHSYSHRDLMVAGKKVLLNEVCKTDKAIKTVIGLKTKLFRPPRGMISAANRKTLTELGYVIVLWTVSSMDWSGLAPKAITRRVKRYIRNGGIILFHDSGALLRSEGGKRGNTVQALPLIIDELRRKGYEIVPLTQMLAEVDHLEDVCLIKETSSSVGQEI